MSEMFDNRPMPHRRRYYRPEINSPAPNEADPTSTHSEESGAVLGGTQAVQAAETGSTSTTELDQDAPATEDFDGEPNDETGYY